jgi:hypothetical protein
MIERSYIEKLRRSGFYQNRPPHGVPLVWAFYIFESLYA